MKEANPLRSETTFEMLKFETWSPLLKAKKEGCISMLVYVGFLSMLDLIHVKGN